MGTWQAIAALHAALGVVESRGLLAPGFMPASSLARDAFVEMGRVRGPW
jgi:hypothetical protein